MAVNVTYAEARETAMRALTLAGVPFDNARTQLDLLVEAELSDRPSHGLLRLPRIVARIRNGVADPVTTGVAVCRGRDRSRHRSVCVRSRALRNIGFLEH